MLYFYKDGFFLDREIHFLNARIKDLENELGIAHYEKIYPCLNVKKLEEYFGKSNSSILKAIERMNKKIDCKCYKNGKLYITSTEVKWLDQNNYRKSYFKELLEYKKLLNERENKMIKDNNTLLHNEIRKLIKTIENTLTVKKVKETKQKLDK